MMRQEPRGQGIIKGQTIIKGHKPQAGITHDLISRKSQMVWVPTQGWIDSQPEPEGSVKLREKKCFIPFRSLILSFLVWATLFSSSWNGHVYYELCFRDVRSFTASNRCFPCGRLKSVCSHFHPFNMQVPSFLPEVQIKRGNKMCT